jgi:hypothetical protein
VILLYILFFPAIFFFPKLLLLIPIYIGLWYWYLWEIGRIYRLESDIQNFDNFKEFLLVKRKFLRGYFKRTRLTYFAIPFIFTLFFVVMISFEEPSKNPFGFLLALFSAQAISMIGLEMNLWLVYRSPLDETEELLRQLDETP